MSKYLLFISLGMLLFFNSCTKDSCVNETTYLRYDAVYVTPEEYRVPVTIEPAQPLKEPGKIYFYKNYIFINEPRKGVHLINNQDPKNPVNERFIAIKGNIDMAIMNDILYVDSYTDLVGIELSNIQNPTQVFRKENVFSSHYFTSNIGILSHYAPTEVKQTVSCQNQNFGRSWFGNIEDNQVFIRFDGQSLKNYSANGSAAPVVTGQGGSMARFTISKSHLYAIGDAEIFSLEILNDGLVSDPNKTALPWGIETIFPYEQNLFVGANNGLHILNIDNPKAPKLVSTFQHARSCDPVVQDDIAYVTLRSGNVCEGFTNQLEVIDVKDILKPKLLYTFQMDNPHGLAVHNNNLFLCEGKFGLKTFDISDLSKIGSSQKSHIKDFHAWDAIALHDNILLVIGEDGFMQYDNANASNLKLLSIIRVSK